MPTGAQPRVLPLLLLPALLAEPALCVRPSEDVVLTPQGSVLQSRTRHASGPIPGDSNHSDGVIVIGSPFVPACDQIVTRWEEGQQACNMDDFLDKAWILALELDCQLNQAEGILKILAERLNQAAKAQYPLWMQEYNKTWNGSQERVATPEAATLTCASAGSGHLWQLLPDEVLNSSRSSGYESIPDWCNLKACSNCSRCQGQMHYLTAHKRHFIMLPQPYKPPMATSYAYDTDNATRVLQGIDEVTHFDFDKINRGLWFANLLGEDDFTEAADILMSKGLLSHVRYVGNDPAIVMKFEKQTESSEKMCIGGPNKNVVDEGSIAYFASNQTLDIRHVRPHWKVPDNRDLRSVASQVVVDNENTPMGALKIDLDIFLLVNRYLENLTITPDGYSAIVNKNGRIVLLSQRACETIFAPNITMRDVLGAGSSRCSGSMTTEMLKNCTWGARKATMHLSDALDTQRFSGGNFTGVLGKMFDGKTNCSEGMQEAVVHFPRSNKTNDAWHTIAFCAFSAVPEWGLLVGAERQHLVEAAHMSVFPSEVNADPNLTTLVRKNRVQARLMIRLELDESPSDKTIAFVLHNDGRIPLPWMVLMPAVQRSSAGEHKLPFGIELLSQPAVLLPGEKTSLDFRLSFKNTSAGYHTESVVIRANEQEPHGSCFRFSLLIRLSVDFKRKEKLTWILWVLRQHGKKVLAGFTILLLVVSIVPLLTYALIYARREFRRQIRDEQRQKMKVNQSLESVNHVSFPMVLVSATDFKKNGKLVSHEELQRKHQDLWLHTMEDLKAFTTERKIIFISHQWTAFASPDPTNMQYEAMVMSIETLRAQENWTEEDTYVWVDYSSIPQKHHGTQTLAINSLTTYASNVAAFVVVAPSVQHADLGETCDKVTYQHRAWCRAEQLAHLLALGDSRMYLAESGVLTHLSEIPDWLDQSKYVFQGDLTCCRRLHVGMEKCDKELLVIPMLGLWAQLCQRCADEPTDTLIATWRKIRDNLEEVFPRNYAFAKPDGSSEKRQLFGDLVDRLPEAMVEERQKKSQKTDS